MSTSKAEIAELVNECYPDEEIVLFDGLEEAFLGIATRSEPIMTMDTEERRMVPSGGTHRYFAVYSYSKIMERLTDNGMDSDEAEEYISFNVEGAYVGESTPAILHDEELA